MTRNYSHSLYRFVPFVTLYGSFDASALAFAALRHIMPRIFVSRKNPVIDPARQVRVFKNWKHDCYSIMQDGRVCASAGQLRLTGVEFLVRESGRERMLRGLPKNVHAYAIGHLVDYVHPEDSRRLETLEGRGVFYNPYRFASFVDSATHAPVTAAEFAHFDEQGVVYTPVEFPLAA